MEDSDSEIDKVTKTLCGMDFVSFNETCALQVHVGQGAKGFPLLVLQKLTSLLLLGDEKLLELVHPKHRLSNRYCKSLGLSGALALKGGSRDLKESFAEKDWFDCCVRGGVAASETGKVLEMGLRNLWHVETLEEFCLLVRPGYNSLLDMAYEFNNLREPPLVSRQERGLKRTIEFRQADGNLKSNPDYALAWVNVAVSLVAFAVEADKEKLEQVITDTRKNLLELKEKEQKGGMFEAAYFRGKTVLEFLKNLGVLPGFASVLSGRAITLR